MKLGSAIFLLAAKLIKQPESKDQTKRPSDPPKMMANNSENIREFILDFTSHFGEINLVFMHEVCWGYINSL